MKRMEVTILNNLELSIEIAKDRLKKAEEALKLIRQLAVEAKRQPYYAVFERIEAVANDALLELPEKMTLEGGLNMQISYIEGIGGIVRTKHQFVIVMDERILGPFDVRHYEKVMEQFAEKEEKDQCVKSSFGLGMMSQNE